MQRAYDGVPEGAGKIPGAAAKGPSARRFLVEGRIARRPVAWLTFRRWSYGACRKDQTAMSLRMRMLALIGLFLALLAVAGAAVMIANARDAVRAEMASALDLGIAVGWAEAGRGAIPDAVAALDRLGLRHLR